MKKATFAKKLRLDKETLQSLTPAQISGARGGIQVGQMAADSGLSASCGMGCDHDTRA